MDCWLVLTNQRLLYLLVEVVDVVLLNDWLLLLKLFGLLDFLVLWRVPLDILNLSLHDACFLIVVISVECLIFDGALQFAEFLGRLFPDHG